MKSASKTPPHCRRKHGCQRHIPSTRARRDAPRARGACAGRFLSGGRCYVHSTVTEENPPDREHPRKRCVIDPVQAVLVVRVFHLFADGLALKKITPPPVCICGRASGWRRWDRGDRAMSRVECDTWLMHGTLALKDGLNVRSGRPNVVAGNSAKRRGLAAAIVVAGLMASGCGARTDSITAAAMQAWATASVRLRRTAPARLPEVVSTRARAHPAQQSGAARVWLPAAVAAAEARAARRMRHSCHRAALPVVPA
jgi:hypothetical protein